MDKFDHRIFPRRAVHLSAIVSPVQPAPVTAVINLSEGGTCLEWSLHEDVPVGTLVHLSFLLDGDQTIEIDGRLTRMAGGHAGIEFLPAQRDIVRQLLAESRSDV